MQKNVGMNFWGRVFIISHRARRGRRGSPLSRTEHTEGAEVHPNVIPCRVLAPGAWNLRGVPYDGFSLARTEDTEGAEAIVTSYFRLHAAYFVLRNLATCISCDGAVGAGSIVPYDAGEIGTGEIGTRKICAGKVGVGEIRASEIYMGKI